jgi:hypothetical protein
VATAAEEAGGAPQPRGLAVRAGAAVVAAVAGGAVAGGYGARPVSPACGFAPGGTIRHRRRKLPMDLDRTFSTLSGPVGSKPVGRPAGATEERRPPGGAMSAMAMPNAMAMQMPMLNTIAMTSEPPAGRGQAPRGRGGPWPAGAVGAGGDGGRFRPPGRRRGRAPLVLAAIASVVALLATVIVINLDRAGGGARRRPAALLLGGRGGPGGGLEVLTESAPLALPPSNAANRFDAGWERRRLATPDGGDGGDALVPAAASARLLVVHLGEEVERTLTLDFERDGLPEGERVRLRTGDRELARATLHAAALPLRLRLPEDLPVGQVPIDVVFDAPMPPRLPMPPTPPMSPTPRVAAPAVRTAAPALRGASLAPALPPGRARIDGADLVMGGNCLVYLTCSLAGREAVVGTFEPPGGARAEQRFELSVERLDGTPIRRFRWLPSFWNRLRGARRFELPLRGTRGAVRLRLVSRAADPAAPLGRWRGLGLVDLTGEIVTPGQGQ